jgi:hypothetical protein
MTDLQELLSGSAWRVPKPDSGWPCGRSEFSAKLLPISIAPAPAELTNDSTSSAARSLCAGGATTAPGPLGLRDPHDGTGNL